MFGMFGMFGMTVVLQHKTYCNKREQIMKAKKLMVVLALAAWTVLSVQAYDAVLKTDDTSGKISCFTNAASWNPTGVPETGKSYCAEGKKLYAPTNMASYDEDGDGTFKGSLTLNSDARLYCNGGYVWMKGGLSLGKTCYLCFHGNSEVHFKGDVSCADAACYFSVASTRTNPVYWEGNLCGSQRWCFVSEGDLANKVHRLYWNGNADSFTATTVLLAMSKNDRLIMTCEHALNFPKTTSFTLRNGFILQTKVDSSFAHMKLDRTKTSGHEAQLDPVNGSTETITKLEMGADATNVARYWTPTNGTISAGTLSISDGVTLVGRYDGTAASAQHPIEVTSKLTFPNGKKVKVCVDYVAGATGAPDNVAVLQVPTAVKTISTSDFELVQGRIDDIANGVSLPTVTNMAVTVENGVQTLRLYPRAVVRMVKHRNDAEADRDATAWSDGKVPHAGADYFTSGYHAKLSSTKFAGTSFSVNAYMSTSRINVDDFRLSAEQIQCYGGLIWYGHTLLLTQPNAWASALIYCASDDYATFKLATEFRGSGNFWAMYRGKLNGGMAYLTGINTNWTGKLRVACQDFPGPSDNYRCDDDKWNVTLVIEDERNLGGKLGSFTYDAMMIRDMCVLAVTNDVTVSDGYNRGILVDYFARVKVPSGKTLALNRPITYNGLLRKEDEGTLAIGAAARFKDGQTATAPMANSNLLSVAAGFVKPTVKGALDGLAITFADGAGLELDAGTEYGLYDEKSGGSVTGSGIPVRINPPTGAEKTPFSVGIVSADTKEAAETLFAKFSVQRPRGYVFATETVENADGTWTVKAGCAPSGMVLIFR